MNYRVRKLEIIFLFVLYGRKYNRKIFLELAFSGTDDEGPYWLQFINGIVGGV